MDSFLELTRWSATPVVQGIRIKGNLFRFRVEKYFVQYSSKLIRTDSSYWAICNLAEGVCLFVRRQDIAWANDDLLLIEHLGTNYSEVGIKI